MSLIATSPAPDVAEVIGIGVIGDRVIRNLQITDVLAEPAAPDLVAFVSEYDPCPAGGFACGATDWCDLRQRMHYILHLFRAYAVDEVLFTAPFTAAHVERFRDGRIPEGEL